MATKNASYIKSQLVADDEVVEGIATDDNGMIYIPDVDDTVNTQLAYATHSHLVTETNSPIWNQVSYDLSFTNTSAVADGHVTLQGVTDMGEVIDIMQHYYSGAGVFTGKKIFDLYGSSCTNAINSQVRSGSTGGANTFQITMPKQYENYEDVDIMANWYDPAWPYRIALQFERSLGKLRGATGHKTATYYGINVVVPYKAHMTDGNFTDIRFTANDGITELDFYILNYSASGNASCIVMVPWWFVDKEREPGAIGTAAYANTDPQWIYCYYGNASATSASDIKLGGNTYFYDDFEDGSIDATKWPDQFPPTHGSITESSGTLNLAVSSGYTETAAIRSQATGAKFDGNYSFEFIVHISEITPINSTTANQGPIIRLYADEAGYFDIRFTYTTGGDGAAIHWTYFARSGSTSGTAYPQYRVNGTTTSNRYLKGTYISSSGNGGGQLIWSVSQDGIYWDIIGRSYRTTYSTSTGGPSSGDVKLQFYDVNQSAAGTAIAFKIQKVLMYPIVGQELEYVDDHFTNGANAQPLDRWVLSLPADGYALEAGTDGSANSGVPGTLKVGHSNTLPSPYHNWTHAVINCPLVHISQKQGSLNNSEVCYYQAKIDTVARGGGTPFGGIFLGTGVTAGSSYFVRYGVKNDGVALSLGLDIISTSSVNSATITTVPTLPCHIRLVIDHVQKKLFADYSSDGIEWIRVYSDASIYYNSTRLGNYHKGAYMGMFSMNSVSGNSGATTFDYFRARTGMRPSVTMTGWNAEEAYADYPLETTTTDTASMTLTYPMPANGPKRGNCIKIRSKPHGGDYTNSKTMYVTNQDLIYIGPDGTDKYIGLRLEFDFNMMDNDTLSVTGINYIYEVI